MSTAAAAATAGKDGTGSGGGGGGYASLGGKGGDGVVIVRISAIVATSVDKPSASETLVYNGLEQIGVAESSKYQFTSGVNKAIEAGQYTCKVKPTGTLTWSDDGTQNEIEIHWSIARREIAAPAPLVGAAPDYAVEYAAAFFVPQTNAVLDASGARKPYSLTMKDKDGVDQPVPDAQLKKADAGTYAYTATLDANYVWAGETGAAATSPKSFTWTITRKPLAKPLPLVGDAPDYRVPYTGLEIVAQTQPENDSLNKLLYSFVVAQATDEPEIKARFVGDYSYTAKLGSNYCWSDNSTDNVVASWSIAPAAIEKPTSLVGTPDVEGAFAVTYTGENFVAQTNLLADAGGQLPYTYTESEFESDGAFKLESIDVGSFRFVAVLNANYTWTDGSRDPVKVKWRVNLADNKIHNLAIEGWEVGMPRKYPSATADFGTIEYAYSQNAHPTGAFPDVWTNAPKFVPGIWYVRAAVEGTANYKAAEDTKTFTLTAGKGSGYRDHITVSVDGYRGSLALTDFPVLVKVSTALAGFSWERAGDSGTNLAFSVGQVFLPYETVKWSPEKDEAEIWVKVPSLPPAGTTLMMHWCPLEETTAALQPYEPTKVWSSFLGVWHFDEEISPSVAETTLSRDSSANRYDLTPMGKGMSIEWTNAATNYWIGNDLIVVYRNSTLNGTLVIPAEVEADVLLVGGGGGGGGNNGGGGGAGGFVEKSGYTLLPNTYAIKVGAGGGGGGNAANGANGTDSSLKGGAVSLVAYGGGGGSRGHAGNYAGATGASGGGSHYTTGAATTHADQGFKGGDGVNGIDTVSGGGGGAGGPGEAPVCPNHNAGNAASTPNTNHSGNGGVGKPSSITGAEVWYAGGGGGGTYTYNVPAGMGGRGGGGHGIHYDDDFKAKDGTCGERQYAADYDGNWSHGQAANRYFDLSTYKVNGVYDFSKYEATNSTVHVGTDGLGGGGGGALRSGAGAKGGSGVVIVRIKNISTTGAFSKKSETASGSGKIALARNVMTTTPIKDGNWLEACGTTNVNFGAFTLSGWMYVDALNADSSSLNVVASKSSGYKADGWAFGVRQTPNPYNLRVVTGANEAAYKQITESSVAGHWQYFSVSYDPSDGTGAILGTDGSYVSTTDGYAGLANCGGAVAPLRFGGMPGAYSLKGRLDEVRLAKGVRSSDWSDAQVAMATDADFLSYGAVNLDGVYQNRWLVVPSVDKTAWFVGEEPLVVDPGLAVANDDLKTITYVNRATDEASPTMPTEHGLYIAVVAIPATDDTTGLEIRFDFQIRDRNPYDDFDAENNGLSGRVLLMNRDTNEAAPVDYQGYNDSVNRNADNVNLPSFWEHVTFEDNTWSGGPCENFQQATESILWTQNYQKMLWHLVDARMGNTYPFDDNAALTTTYCYLPWSSTSYSILDRRSKTMRWLVGQINLRNILDARVVSSWFTDGIGTVYFDAVDFEGMIEHTLRWHAHEIVVEYSTDAKDDAVAHEMGTNTWTKVELHPVLIHTEKRTAEPEPPTKAFNIDCRYIGGNLAFYRIYAPINCRQPCRFRIRRTTNDTTGGVPTDRLPITLDNIIVSYPQQRAEFETYGIRDDTKTGKQVMGQELAWNTPFPSAKDPLIARAKPVFYPSAGASVPDEDLIVLGKMHYRWVYLNQITSEWKTVTLYPHLDYSAEAPLELPGAQGDVEYWYELEQRPSFYEYVDYTGADFGLGGVYSEEVRAVTNRSSMLEVKCDHVWNRIDEREPGETTIGYTVDECEICHMTWRREQNSHRADYKSIVPAPYVDLEYVESKRAQYVDLGFSPTATTCIYLDFYLHPGPNQTDDWDQDNGERAIFGTSWSWSNSDWLFHLRPSNGELPIQNNSNLNPSHVNVWDRRMVFEIDSTGSKLRFQDGTNIGSVNSTRPNTGTKTFYLFGSNVNDGRHSATRVYAMKVWSDNAKANLIRDLVPAKDKDGVPGLYDLVEKKFYKSGTATALVAGDTLPEGESAGPDTYVEGENMRKDWFVRQRDGVSDYEGMTLYVEGKTRVPGSSYKTEVFDQKIEMELVKDHVWRGYVKTPTNIADNVISYRVEGVNRQTPGAKEFAYNRACWYQSEYIAAYPMSGSLASGTEGDWQQLPVDALTGYLLVQVDDSANSVTVLHADYCDMNRWNDIAKGDGLFTGSSITNETRSGVSSAAREYKGDFKTFLDSSPTSKYWEEHFNVDVSDGTRGYKLYEKFLSETTPNGWKSGTGQWVYGKYMDANSGLALQMFGQGQGELIYTGSVVEPRGLESLSFNARLSQFIDLNDDELCYSLSTYVTAKDYAVVSRNCFDTKSNTSFGGAASLSMFGYFRPMKGAYEFRVTWIKEGSRNQEMALYRWNYSNSKGYYETPLCVYTNSASFNQADWPKAEGAVGSNANYAPMFVSFHTTSDKGTIVTCGFSKTAVTPSYDNALMITNKTWSGFTYIDNTSSKLTAGTFGFMSANCPARFYQPLKLKCATDKITTGGPSRFNSDYNGLSLPIVENLGASVPEETAEQNEGDWAVPTGRIIGYHDDYGGGFKAQPVTQRLDIYTSKLGHENWGAEPVATVSFDDFGSVAKEFKFYRTDDCSVRIAVGGELDDVRTDITIDDVVMRQWRGDEISNTNTMGDAGISTKDSNYTYGCITNFTFHSGWFTNGCVRLSARRTESGSPCGVRSPMFDGIDGRAAGLGMFSVGYADAQSNCRLLLQIATNFTYTSLKNLNESTSEKSWHTVTNWDFSAVDPIRREKGTLSCYLGLHGVRGVMRLIVDPALVDELKDSDEQNPLLFGEITVTSCLARDEPKLDESCWWGWNVGATTGEKRAYMPDWPIVAGDPGGMNLALNNSITDGIWPGVPETQKELMKLHMPFVQTPTFSTNIIGEVTFRARKYDLDQERTSYVTLYGSTTGSLVDDEADWKNLCVFPVTNATFELFTFKVDPASSYKAFRLANTGVPGVEKPGTNPEPGTEPCRVLIDEVLVSEAIRARVAFRNVAAFRDNLAGTESLSAYDLLRKDQQPLLGEQWGVQAEVYPAMLPDEVDFATRGHEPRVKLYWYEGDYPWGFDKWRDLPGAKSAYLSRAVGGEADEESWIFRSSQQLSLDALITPSVEPDAVVQFMLEVEWYQVGSSEMQVTRLQPGEWTRPSWYAPLDYNRDYGKGLPSGFSAYTILNAISPGWAWINEVNLFGDEEDKSGNSDRDCQYVEIAAPAEADIRGWKLQMLVSSSKGLLETNLLATFGTGDVKSTKDATYSSANMVFHVIASPLSAVGGKLLKADGTLDGAWPDTLTTSKSSAMKNGVIDPNEPVCFLLERPNGIVEHVVTALGTNFWTSLGEDSYPSPKWLSDTINAKANLGSFSLGEDCNTRTNSLGVFASRGEGRIMWNDTMKKTPGRINEKQTINPDHPTPNSGSIIVYASVDQAGGPILQSVGDAFDTTSTKILVVPVGSTRGTNIVYRVPPWYAIESVTTNGVAIAGADVTETGVREWTVNVAKGCSNNVNVIARAKVEDRLARDYGLGPENAYTPAVLEWLRGGRTLRGDFADDGELRLADYVDVNTHSTNEMSLTQMYWLDMDPTVGGLVLESGVGTPEGVDREWGAVTMKDKVLPVYMCVKSRSDGSEWSPYVLRGLAPNETSWDYPAQYGGGNWTSVTFKVTGMLNNGLTKYDNPDNWIPLRWFVFKEDSFDADHMSEVELIDPTSKSSMGYGAGWYDWVKTHGDPGFFFKSTIDTRLRPIAVEVLHPSNLYD